MIMLKDYEKRVISLLTSQILSSDQLDNVLRGGLSVGFEDFEGSGYFLHIRHLILPKERIVCSEPIVIGETENITCGFVIFIENGELSLECHDWGEADICENFRDKDIQIRQVRIEEGKFVSI